MKTKTFSADGPAAIIQAVNDWLAGENGVTIHRTETEPAVTDPGTGATQMRFCVWYEHKGDTP